MSFPVIHYYRPPLPVTSDRYSVTSGWRTNVLERYDVISGVSPLSPITSGHFPVISGRYDVTSGWYADVLERCDVISGVCRPPTVTSSWCTNDLERYDVICGVSLLSPITFARRHVTLFVVHYFASEASEKFFWHYAWPKYGVFTRSHTGYSRPDTA